MGQRLYENSKFNSKEVDEVKTRTTLVIYNDPSKVAEELTLIKRWTKPAKWIVTIPKFEFTPRAHNFSPEGVKSCYEDPAYLKVFEHYVI